MGRGWRCSVCGGYGPAMVPTGRTYVARRGRWVKIGYTGQAVDQRLRQLRGHRPNVRFPPSMDWSAPLRLVASSPWNVEHDLHEQFADAHDTGEWFVDVDDASAVVVLRSLTDMMEHWWGAPARWAHG